MGSAWGERRVAPLRARLVGEALEAGDVLLAQLRHLFLRMRIAKVDATAQRPRLARRAQVALLPRTERTVHRPGERRRVGEQDVGLQAAEEQRVAVLLEAAAAAARLARRPRGGDLRINLAVQFEYLLAQRRRHGGPHRMISFMRREISSKEISSPWPEPGQTAQVRCHASGVSMLLAQNGQVRHWRGRTS